LSCEGTYSHHVLPPEQVSGTPLETFFFFNKKWSFRMTGKGCNTSTLFCVIPDTATLSPESKHPSRPCQQDLVRRPPVNDHGIHHHPNIKLEVNWNSSPRPMRLKGVSSIDIDPTVTGGGSGSLMTRSSLQHTHVSVHVT